MSYIYKFIKKIYNFKVLFNESENNDRLTLDYLSSLKCDIYNNAYNNV